jgi:hypothetical protein
MNFIYRPKDEGQLRSQFSRIIGGGSNGFNDYGDFFDWYRGQNKACHYCGLLEVESQEIVMTGKLTSRRFPQNGVIGQGTSRGVWLEIDRSNPNGLYSRENCVLCCYFCNNDKSDVFHGVMYPQFFQNRVTFLRNLLNGD